uniref:Uncharacterized protein n=1 Tax=Biomphalaria glabrata TaxID=6526 RepID=A0A2C9KZ74_BIOGL
MVGDTMAQVTCSRPLRRSESLMVSSRPGLTSNSRPVRSSSSWSSFSGLSPRPLGTYSARPVSSRPTASGSSRQPKKQSENSTQAREGINISRSASNRESIQRLTNGGSPHAQSLPGQKRMSLDTTVFSSLPGNKSDDGFEPKSILKHPSRRFSASYGELAAKSALLPQSTSPAFHNLSSTTSPTTRTHHFLVSSAQFKSPDEEADALSEEVLLKKCQYRLGPSLSSLNDASSKKVTFDDDVFVISK